MYARMSARHRIHLIIRYHSQESSHIAIVRRERPLVPFFGSFSGIIRDLLPLRYYVGVFFECSGVREQVLVHGPAHGSFIPKPRLTARIAAE
jgi:hypothetical protein